MGKLVHIITGLPVGGAQTVLLGLARHRHRVCDDIAVISLGPLGEVGEELRGMGVETRALGLDPARPSIGRISVLAHWLRELRPSIVQTWLYHGDLIGGVAARMTRVPRVIWNLRQTDLGPDGGKLHTQLTMWACARLSRVVPERIVCCSEATRDLHAGLGYDRRRMTVIGNGVDAKRFRPDSEARQALLAELGANPDDKLIGLAARYHPQKDHETFLASAAVVAGTRPNTRFVLCGEDVDAANLDLADAIAKHGLAGRVDLLGVRKDVERILAGVDFAVSSSSFGEGFSNVTIEAMACGTPCIVTDVGDSRSIVADTGWCVAPRDAAELAAALLDALALDSHVVRRRSAAARAKIEQHHSLETVLDRYAALYNNAGQGESVQGDC